MVWCFKSEPIGDLMGSVFQVLTDEERRLVGPGPYYGHLNEYFRKIGRVRYCTRLESDGHPQKGCGSSNLSSSAKFFSQENGFRSMVKFALKKGYTVEGDYDGDEVRKKYNYTRSTIGYDRAVILHKRKEDGTHHSSIRIEELPGSLFRWSMVTDHNRYRPKPWLKFEGSDPEYFVECLPKIVGFEAHEVQLPRMQERMGHCAIESALQMRSQLG